MPHLPQTLRSYFATIGAKGGKSKSPAKLKAARATLMKFSGRKKRGT